MQTIKSLLASTFNELNGLDFAEGGACAGENDNTIAKPDWQQNLRIDIEHLLAHCLQKNRSYLYAFAEQTITALQYQQFLNLLNQYKNGHPIAYLLGSQPFWTLDLAVAPGVLIPRADTECLVEYILQLNLPEKAAIIDLGLGSAAIALALATEQPNWHVFGVELHEPALSVAKKNIHYYSATVAEPAAKPLPQIKKIIKLLACGKARG